MVNKIVKKLPKAAQKMYHTVLSELGDSPSAAWKALEIVEQSYQPIGGIKNSIPLDNQNATMSSDGTYIDVLMGYPSVSHDGLFFDDSFWKNVPQTPLKGDMEHLYSRRADGEYIDDSEDYEGWVPVSEKYWTADTDRGTELWARVALPEHHPYTQTFKQRWENGEIGASIEVPAPNDDAIEYKWIDGQLRPALIDGQITGFSFTDRPSIDTKTQRNGNE